MRLAGVAEPGERGDGTGDRLGKGVQADAVGVGGQGQARHEGDSGSDGDQGGEDGEVAGDGDGAGDELSGAAGPFGEFVARGHGARHKPVLIGEAGELRALSGCQVAPGGEAGMEGEQDRVVHEAMLFAAGRQVARQQAVGVDDSDVRLTVSQGIDGRVGLTLDDAQVQRLLAALSEATPHLGQQDAGGGGEGGDADQSAAAPAQSMKVGLGGGEAAEDDLGVLHQELAGRGEAQRPALLLQQREARLFLQRGELLGDRRAGEVQGLGGRRHSAVDRELTQQAHAPHIQQEVHLLDYERKSNWIFSIVGETLKGVNTRPTPLRFLALAVTVLLWASAFPAIRVAVDGLGVRGLSLLRLAVASVALAAVGPLLKVRRPRRRDLPLIALCGATGMSAYQVFLNWGEVHVPAGTASLLVSVAPVFSVLLATAFLGEPLTATIVLGSAIALAGAAVIALTGGSAQVSAGALVVLAAGVAQGVYHFATKPLLKRYTGLEVACYAMWTGTLFLLPLAPTAAHDLAAAPASAAASAVYLGLLPSALGFVTWGYAVARFTLARSTAALYLVPPVALAVAFVWLGETPRPIQLLGGLISIAGVILIHRPRPTPAPSPQPDCAVRPAPDAGPSRSGI